MVYFWHYRQSRFVQQKLASNRPWQTIRRSFPQMTAGTLEIGVNDMNSHANHRKLLSSEFMTPDTAKLRGALPRFPQSSVFQGFKGARNDIPDAKRLADGRWRPRKWFTSPYHSERIEKGRQIGMATSRPGRDSFFLAFDLVSALASESMEAHGVAMAITSAASLSSSNFSPKQAFADSQSLYT
jgi:hypothetical protein